jgi:hypothetical protein
MADIGRERREFQRIPLQPSLPGYLDEVEVDVIEVGIPGARVEHLTQIFPAAIRTFRFSPEGTEIALECEVIRSEVRASGGLTLYRSGLQFTHGVGSAGELLRKFLISLVAQQLEIRAELPSIVRSAKVDGDITVRGKDAGFISFRLENGTWRKKRLFLPEQPENGFTIAAGVDAEEIEKLCKAYEATDAEGRRLLRFFAELIVSQSLGLPPSD